MLVLSALFHSLVLSALSDRSVYIFLFFFFSSRRRHTRFDCDWSSDVCSSDLALDARNVTSGDSMCTSPSAPVVTLTVESAPMTARSTCAVRSWTTGVLNVDRKSVV